MGWTVTLEGIDVSSYQGVVDWHDVHASGKAFAAVKATEGMYYQDKQFPRNWERTKLRGIMRGAYHFLRPSESGVFQADYFHAYVRSHGGFEPGDFIMLDCEVTDNEPPQAVVQCAELFVRTILNDTRQGLYFYTYPDFWLHQLGNPTSHTLGVCPLWLADYGPTVPHIDNWPQGLTVWQYSQSGHVRGVNGLVDLNRFYGDLAAFKALARLGGREG